MAGQRSESIVALKIEPDGTHRRPDDLVIEEPLSIELDGVTICSTMRTPGHDFELSAGFLWAEGAIDKDSLASIRYCAGDFNKVKVTTRNNNRTIQPRIGTVTSACGACGVDAIEHLTQRLEPAGPYEPWDLSALAAMPEVMRPGQALFDVTGAVHGAAAISRDGEALVVREDIGRHNAADKVTGRLFLDGFRPDSDLALVTSGRASFEMVQKAWAGGFTALVAVSGVSRLAVDTARRAGLTLVGFARNGSGTCYSPIL